MNVRQFIKTAEPGAQFVYHKGIRLVGADGLPQLRGLYDRGMIDFVQRRVDKQFEYIAVFRMWPVKIPSFYTFAHAGLEVR